MSNELRYAPLGLNFDIPSDEAFRLDINDHELRILILAALNAVAQLQAGGVSGSTPVSSAKAVTDAVSTISNAGAARRVRVYNNGDKSALIDDGGTPAWVGGGQPVTVGIEIAPGDYWFSDVPIVTDVKAVAKSGESTSLTVTNYPL